MGDMNDLSDTSRAELGNFLRARRERLDPLALGIGGGRRRRTPGLRREEVAELAGIGVDWYIRLEQGRDVQPPPPLPSMHSPAHCGPGRPSMRICEPSHASRNGVRSS